MSRLYPDLYLERVYDLGAAQLKQWGTALLVLDVDNTLTTHDNPIPNDRVLSWLDEMRELGMKLVILSNNTPDRVRPFAAQLGLPFTARACKPLIIGLRRTAREFRVTPEQMVMVGDQIFTDILGGNRFGAKTVLVEPMELEAGAGFRFKRNLEQKILHGYNRNK